MRIGEPLRQDLRYAWRLMMRSPAFTVAILLTLGLGVGANTAIFTLVNAVLLESLPVHEPERLVVLERITPRGTPSSITYPLYEWLRDEPAFAGVFAAQNDTYEMPLRAGSAASRDADGAEAAVQLVSGEYFEVLGARPLVGRTFTRDVNRKPASEDAAVAVLSHGFWQQRFNGDTRVVGQTITLKEQPVTIIGVMRPEFFGELVGRAPDVWVPLTLQPRFDRGRSYIDDPNVGWLNTMGRLAPGVTPDAARAALDVAVARVKSHRDTSQSMRHVASIAVSDGARGLSDLRERFSRSLQILTAVVGLVLLITCANVSNLLLARAAVRQREVAVRLAIGAGRGRLVRQFLTESTLLAMGGAAVGLLIAWWGSRVLVLLVSTDTNTIAIDVTPDGRVLAFTLAVSLAAALLFGLAPALTAARLDVASAFVLRTTARGRSRFSPFLVVAQVALSLVLLTGAALFVQTLRNLRTQDLGFAAETILQAHIRAESSGYTGAQIPDLSRRILERLTTTPGVRAASIAGSGFGTGTSATCCIAVEGFAHQPGEDRQVRTNAIGTGYFRAMNLPLRLGRDFEARDDPGDPRKSARVAIVNEAFARRYYGRENPVGRRFGWGNPPKVTYGIEIVGVAADAVYGDLRAGATPLIYFPSAAGELFVVRATGTPEAFVSAVQREIRAVDPQLEMVVTTIGEVVERGLVREKLLAKLSSVFGLIAAALASLGLYGLVAFGVVNRTRDIGIRMALGAQRGQVLRAELRAALWLVVVGIIVGVPAAIVAGRLIAAQLFGVTAGDPITIASTVLLLALVAAPAAYLPARRASHIEPWLALRSE